MILVASDENISGAISRGLLKRNPSIDLVRIQDVGLRTASDEEILEWCARENRVLISHDRNTIIATAYSRVRMGRPMPGVFLVDNLASLRETIDSLLLLIQDSVDGEWNNTIQFVPL